MSDELRKSSEKPSTDRDRRTTRSTRADTPTSHTVDMSERPKSSKRDGDTNRSELNSVRGLSDNEEPDDRRGNGKT